MSRNSPNGSTREWRRLRARKLSIYPLCEHPGCHAMSEEVDHIIPLKEWPEGRMVWSNLRALCGDHHKLRHGQRPRDKFDPVTGRLLSEW